MNKKNISIIIIIGVGLLLLAGIFFAFRGIKNSSDNVKNITPSLLSISPTGLPQNSVGVTLRVYGHNFTKTSIINWNGSAMPTDTKNIAYGFLTTTIPAENFTNYGDYPVTVTNDPNKTSNAINFTVVRTLDDVLGSPPKQTN